MRQREAPSYSSSRVQRATRINGIEAVRLEQTLQYLEKAKLHQCRLSNQDIRLISLSLDYIQMSSGHSPEALRPPEPRRPVLQHSPVISEDDDSNNDNVNDMLAIPEVLSAPNMEAAAEEDDHQSPFFLYGERIWQRKRRRIQRPMSAVPTSRRSGIGDASLLAVDNASSDSSSTIAAAATTARRPKSSPGKQQVVVGRESNTAISATGRHNGLSSGVAGSVEDRDATFVSQAAGVTGYGVSTGGGGLRREEGSRIEAWGPQTFVPEDHCPIVLTSGLRLSRESTPRGRVTPHQDWEDDTAHVTKKILKSQAQTQKGGRQQQSLYQAPGEVMTSAAARNVRGLARQIRVSAATPAATPILPDRSDLRPPGTTPMSDRPDFPPTRPPHDSGLQRRATLGEILNQRRPTLSSDAWRSHLGQSSDTPMSLAARRQRVMESRRELNQWRSQAIAERVKSFISDSAGSVGEMPRSTVR